MNVKVEVKLTTEEAYISDPIPLAEFRSRLEDIVAQVPYEYRESITLAFPVGGYDGAYCNLEAYYERPETPKETEQREKAEAWHKTLRCQNDLRILAELKAKYESGTP